MAKIYTFSEFIFEAKKHAKMKEEKAEKKPAKKSSKKKKDQDGDGDMDFADAKIAQYTAGGMNKKKAVALSRKFNVSESSTVENGTSMSIVEMLKGKEFPGLTKQEDNGIVYYSLLGPNNKKRLFIKFKVSPNNWIETTITATDPNYFKTVETLFNSLNSFEDIGPSSGLDKGDSEIVIGTKQTQLDRQEILQIFDTLVKYY